MSSQQYGFSYEVFKNAAELRPADRELLKAAQACDFTGICTVFIDLRWEPLHVCQMVKLSVEANQENASFPAGLCAEGVLLAVASSRIPRKK